MQSSSSDWTATSRYDAGSSGYESAEENLIKEMDPNEGPYQVYYVLMNRVPIWNDTILI